MKNFLFQLNYYDFYMGHTNPNGGHPVEWFHDIFKRNGISYRKTK
ncbi:MAG TPA: hypothetical protein VF487_06120 [Chitinophagaceae bacterium]